MIKVKKILIIFLVFLLMCETLYASSLNQSDKKLLINYAKATFEFMKYATNNKTFLPLDALVWEDGNYSPSHTIPDIYSKHNYNTSPTNIGLYLSSIVSAYDFKFITKDQAISMIKKTLNSIKKLKTYNYKGVKTTFLYNWYDTNSLGLGKWPTANGYKIDGGNISSVDNGWYAAGLIVTKEAFKELEKDINPILNGMKWDIFLRKDTKRLAVVIDPKTGEQIGEYGLIATEPRIASYIGIIKGDLPKNHWWNIKRVFHVNYTKGEFMTKDSTTFFEGYEEVDLFPESQEGKLYHIVPSWGGSMFEFLMPSLFVKERELGTKGLGLNNKVAVQIQIDWAKGNNYDLWGFSPCAVPSPKGYSEFGVPGSGVYNHDFYGNDLYGYSDKMLEYYGDIKQDTWAGDPVVTPYASFLALEYMPTEALENIKKMDSKYKAFSSKYGFCDAINFKKKQIHRAYLMLDNSMILLSLNNYLNNNAIKNRFHKQKNINIIENLLKEEKMEVGISTKN
ncbi:glucoamylase family protein [Caldicellulosiruptoraceae bacterium PP1]